jgi:hypothetical protein
VLIEFHTPCRFYTTNWQWCQTERTESYSYDIYSQPIATDGPISGGADTSRVRYDALGRVVGSISPDPDGTGPLKYGAVRTSYTADGQVDMVEAGTVTGLTDADWAAFVPLQRSKASYDASGKRVRDEVITVTAGVSTTQAVTQYSYDNRDRLLCTAQRLNPAVFGALPADACTLGTTGTAGPDRISKASYDDASQTTGVIEALGVAGVQRTAQTLSYGNNGQLLSFTDAKGNLTAYTGACPGQQRSCVIRERLPPPQAADLPEQNRAGPGGGK